MKVGAMELIGRLLYQGPMNSLVTLDLRDWEEKPVVENLPFSFNNGLIKKDNKNIIVSVVGRLMEINIESGRVQLIGKAYRPEAYLQNSQTLFYLDGGARLGLFDANLNDIANTARRIGTETTPGYIGLVSISDSEVVFYSAEHSGRIWRYNVTTKELKLAESVTNCWPIFFRETTKQLICATSERGKYSLVTLQGERQDLVGFPRNASPLIYIPKHDVLLYTQPVWWPLLSEERDLYAYDLKTGKTFFLKKNMGLPAGTIIYLE